MRVITGKESEDALREACSCLHEAEKVVALTGAGASVGSGIPDFRSEGGLWSVYEPGEYATLDVFYQNPAKAWELYRALGNVLLGKQANPAHHVLAELESQKILAGIVTQNVDNLHQQAGSKTVLEIHGDHQHLQCLQCGFLEPVRDEHYGASDVPLCPDCRFPLKPNVVLFGEAVRKLDEIDKLMTGCDLLLVIGTSAQVYPAAGLPHGVKREGGTIFEFNCEPALGYDKFTGISSMTDYFFLGEAEETLPMLLEVLRGQ